MESGVLWVCSFLAIGSLLVLAPGSMRGRGRRVLAGATSLVALAGIVAMPLPSSAAGRADAGLGRPGLPVRYARTGLPEHVRFTLMDKAPAVDPAVSARIDAEAALLGRFGYKSEPIRPTPVDPNAAPVMKPAVPPTEVSDTLARKGAAVAGDYGQFRLTQVDNGHGHLTDEPDVAANYNYVMETWNNPLSMTTPNWPAAGVSRDGGQTFAVIDPREKFGFMNGANFCCDQLVHYIPSYDMWIWILQYDKEPSGTFAGGNAIRIAVANSSANMANGAFYSYTLHAGDFGYPKDTFWDRPMISNTDGYLHIGITNYVPTGASGYGGLVMRFPLGQLANGQGLSIGSSLAWNTIGFVDNAGSTMHYATHVTTSSLRVYSWADSDASPTSTDVTHSAYPDNKPMSCLRTGAPSSSNWCNRMDSRVMTGWRENGRLSFSWIASQGTATPGGFSFPYPFLYIVRINESTKALIDEPYIYNPGFAFGYGFASANARGDVGGMLMWGGGSVYHTCGTMLRDSYSPSGWELHAVVSDDSDRSFAATGDYFGTWGNGGNEYTWSGTCHAVAGGGAMSNLKTYYVAFGRQQDNPMRSLVLTKPGDGTGTVTSSPAGINCGSSCTQSSADYTSYTKVDLTASPDTYSTFAGFAGANGQCSGTGTTCTLYVDPSYAAQYVTATFNAIKDDVIVTNPGDGTGSVSSNPAGINSCTSYPCSAKFKRGQSVTLSASAGTYSTFAGWNGAGCSGTGSCTFTPTDTTYVTATFNAIKDTLTVSKSGTGGGSVSTDPAGINSCSSFPCAAQFKRGTSVTISASADGNSTFGGWSGAGCSGTGTCVVSMSGGAIGVTATFNPKAPTTHQLTVNKSPQAGGTVTGGGIDCGSICTTNVSAGSTVQLSATEASGYSFSSWTGCDSTSGSQCSVTMNSARSVTANFTAVPAVTASITTPTTLNGAFTYTFSGDVSGVTKTNAVIRVTGTTTDLSASLVCKNASATTVNCATGPVRTVTRKPTSALVAGQYYTATVNPSGVSPATYGAGTAVQTANAAFRAATLVDDVGTWTQYAWPTVVPANTSSAFGGSFVQYNRSGARAAYDFRGSEIIWYTRKGPDQGKVEVTIDGVAQNGGVPYDLYASTATNKVPFIFSGLSPGVHTLAIMPKGTKNASSTNTWVAVDAFRVDGGTIRATPAATYRWAAVTVAGAPGPYGGSYQRTDVVGASVTFTFRGTNVSWRVVKGPNFGKETILVDAGTPGQVTYSGDDYAASTTYGAGWTLPAALADGVHTVTIKVSGNKNASSTGTMLGIDRFSVT